MSDEFSLYLISSYAVGWVLNAFHARSNRMLDLCQFVRHFILSPFVLALAMIVCFLAEQFVVRQLVPYWDRYLLGAVFVVGAVVVLFVAGQYAVAPAVKKAYGVAKPFSDKICIVLYRKR